MNIEKTKQNQDTVLSDGSHQYWFALKVFYNKVYHLQSELQKQHLTSYFPSEEVRVERHGVWKTIHKPVISSLLFFRATVRQALQVQKDYLGQVILYTRVKDYKRMPLVIPERQMNLFLLVTSHGQQGLEYFGEDHPKYHQGDRVRVIDGPFRGAEGHICRIRKDRRLVVTVDGVCAVATSYIPQCFLQKVEEGEKR